MSGALAQHRPANKPLFDDHGLPVYRVPKEGPGHYPFDWKAVKRTLHPGGLWKKGRCQDYSVTIELRQQHVLVPAVEQNRPSKHARGRIRPRTPAERRKSSALRARFAQISKTMTVDHNRMRAIHDEVPA